MSIEAFAQTKLESCTAIKNDIERLACFDENVSTPKTVLESLKAADKLVTDSNIKLEGNYPATGFVI